MQLRFVTMRSGQMARQALIMSSSKRSHACHDHMELIPLMLVC